MVKIRDSFEIEPPPIPVEEIIISTRGKRLEKDEVA